MKRTVFDLATQQSVTSDLSADDETKLADRAVIEQAASDAETQRRAALAAARPGAAIIQKLKDGTALTAGELQTVIRWMALKVARL